MLELTIKDFGPIIRGRFELAPLTVFVGPNNSGKSVSAMLAYAATHAGVARGPYVQLRSDRGGAMTYRGMYWGPPIEIGRDRLEAVSSLVERLTSNERLPTKRMSSEALAFLGGCLQNVLREYADGLRPEVARCFGGRLNDLSRNVGPKRRRRFTVSVGSQDEDWSVAIGTAKTATEITNHVDVPRLLRKVRRANGRFFESTTRRRAARPPELWARDLVGLTASALFGEMPAASYYLPAARSGFLQSHRAIASSVVSRAPYAGIEDWQIPKMSGVIADFISNLLSMPDEPQNRQINEVADYLEAVLRGSIRLEAKPGSYPEIWYESDAGSFPLYRTSSMVSELAPIVLYMRYLLDPNELLVIEEPESHLHPASQLVLAKALVRLVRRGVRVLLTTHSDYFLSQLNNLIRAASLPPERYTRRSRIHPDEALHANLVRAYLFSMKQGGTEIDAVRVTQQDGVSASEFARVAEPLYAETVALTRQIELDDVRS